MFLNFSGCNTGRLFSTENFLTGVDEIFCPLPRCLSGEVTTAAAQGTITVDSNAIAIQNGLIIATFPAMDIPHANDVCLHFRITRLGAGGNDDLTDTAELHGIVMLYTSNKLGTAT